MVLTSVVNALAFPRPPRQASADELREHPGLLWLTTADGSTIPAVHVKPRTPKRQRRFCVLYSHGNAEDIGECVSPLVYAGREDTHLPTSLAQLMADTLDADVIAYEFEGYSLSSAAAPSEAGLYRSAMAAYEKALQLARAEDIVPFGRSLGSAPAVHMAANAPTPCAALLLQSPLMSGAQAILGPTVATAVPCADVFKNYAKIGNARCRVAIAHGTADEVVGFSNGKALHRRCADAHEPLWCPGRGHNNMDEKAVLRYFHGVLDYVEANQT